MSDLVMVRIGQIKKPVGREFAEGYELEVLEESAYTRDGRVRDEEPLTGDEKSAAKSAEKSAKAANTTKEK